MAYNLSEEEKRLQKKLIPLNIVVCVISLLAALSLMFAPLLTVDIGKLLGVMMADSGNNDSGSPSDSSDYGSEGEDYGDDHSSDSDVSSGSDFDLMGMLKSVDVKISISALSAAKVAFAPEDKKAEALIGDILLGTNLIDNVMKNMVNVMFAEMVDGVGGEEGEQLSELVDTLDKLDNVKNKTEFDGVINEYLDKFAQDGEAMSADEKAEFIETCDEFYDLTMQYADDFSLEAMICVLVSSGMMNGDGDGEENVDPQNVATSYSELLTNALSGEEGAMGDIGESFAEMKEQMNGIAGFYGYLFYVMLFFAAMWLILFISALRRIFSQNKRFTMWAVKLFGFIPCLIFGVAPLVFKGIAGTLFEGETGEMMTSLIGAISSTTWISGACYILLWLISIFWAFPIKRKIRQLKKQ